MFLKQLKKFSAIKKHSKVIIRKLKTFPILKSVQDDNYYEEILNSDREYQAFSENYFKLNEGHNCYIIQPYVKWGPQKLNDITPIEQLDEAKSLIKTLPFWSVEDAISVPLETLDKKLLFKSGSLEKLKQNIKHNGSISAIFVNMGNLKRNQASSLEKEFKLPILDRYKIVMQILKLHATSKHAKLQVSMAELYYLQRKAVFSASSDRIKLIFKNREQKLKNAIKKLRQDRALLRNKRQKNDFPIIAVVGYTNSGKTSLIKALTGEQNLKPKNQLFATLDVTMHAGLLPSGLEVLYVDTVGFISDIPTNLIECFVATLEDAVLADIILHVEDISSSCYEFKRQHVLSTLENLSAKTGTDNILNKTVNVGNKCDLVANDQQFDVMKVSAQTDFGLDALRLLLETKILEHTNRKKITFKLPIGGDEMRWLYKNSAVISEVANEEDNELIIANVIISHSKLQQFKHYFLKS